MSIRPDFASLEVHMHKLVSLSVAIVLMASAGHALASADLLKKHNCVACHAEQRKLLGPAYKDIAEKYAGDAGAAEKLARKIREGGAGVWGQMPMPPHPQLSEAEALALAKYVLAIKPSK